MSPAVKVYGAAGNSRFRRVLAVAALANVGLETDKDFSMAKDWRTPEYLRAHPFGYLPALAQGDFHMQEVDAICEYIASIGTNPSLLPKDAQSLAISHQWQSFADQEIFHRHAAANSFLNGKTPWNRECFDAFFDRLMQRLSMAETEVGSKKYLLGDDITLADITLATCLVSCFIALVDAQSRSRLPNLVRYTDNIIKDERLAHIFANTKYTETLQLKA